MSRVLVSSSNFNSDANGTFPTGFTNLNGSTGEIRVINPTGTAGTFQNAFTGSDADARDAATFSNDQYAQIAVVGLSGGNVNDSVGIGLRFGTGTTGGAGVDGYRIKLTDGGVGARTVRAYSVVAGVETQIGSTATIAIAINDTISAEIVGSSLTCYWNGAAIAGLTAVTTITHTTGKPGITGNPGGNNTVQGDLYEAGDITSGSLVNIMGQACL